MPSSDSSTHRRLGGGRLAILVAVAENGVIGRGNALPWRLSEDLKRFKALTIGRVVVMGRKTAESIGKPLPGRRNIVVTRQPSWGGGLWETAPSLRAALDAAEQKADEVFVIGGAEIYAQALPLAGRLYLTRVHARPDGDVVLPALGDGWVKVSSERHEADARNEHPFTFEVYERS